MYCLTIPFVFPPDLSDLDPNADLKSPISLVHEIALKRNLTVAFEVVKESGPPHMRTFVTRCIVGEYRTEGEGTGKKVGGLGRSIYLSIYIPWPFPPF